MSVKPVLLKDLRRDAIRNHQANTGNGSYNRFSPLVTRERSLSTAKRQLSNDEDDSDTDTRKRTKVDGQAIFDQLKNQDTMISELEELIKASTPVASSQEDAEPPPAPDPVWKAIGLLLKLHKGVLSAVIDWGGKGNTISRGNVPLSLVEARGTPVKKRSNPAPAPVPVPAPSPEETAEKNLKQSIRDAEKKLVIFNLDYGSAPCMNKDTLARKVTMALSNKVREGKHDYHIGDAEEVLDDILSCSKLEFLGTSTKQFYNKKNPEDSRNKVMHTVPVRLEFKDRETRLQAEISLRKICKVNCAVPYPKIIRDQLGSLLTEGKKKQPDCFIRTRVNAEQLTIDAFASVNKKWIDLDLCKKISVSRNAAIEPDTGAMEVTAESQDFS